MGSLLLSDWKDMWPRYDEEQKSDPIALADADRLAMAECYQKLNRNLLDMGEAALADIFAGLAADSFALLPDHLRDERRNALLAKSNHHGPAKRCDATTCRTAYDSWATAANMEREAATHLISLISRTEDPGHRQLLMRRAREALQRAADHRVHRRAAYHGEKIGALRASFPDVRRIQDQGDLAHLAIAIEGWMLRVLAAVATSSPATKAIIGRLQSLVAGRPVPRRLKTWIDNLNALPGTLGHAKRSKQFSDLLVSAEAGRIFDYYDLVFEGSEDAGVLALAQELSANAMQRLKALRAKPLH